ncbi:MAG TPA: hypothetical protein VFC44_01585 [Candidatus Saccharimonadales bacterium]|nr:hypothetical protein [Candidatus Saccharimonadales bacterium]
MNPPIKLLVDECLAPRVVEDLEKMLKWDSPPPQIRHLTEYFKRGTRDDSWIPEIANEGWVILSADRGKKSGPKLPAICVAYHVTHILVGPSILHLKQFQRIQLIISSWNEIRKCAEAPQGSRFALRLNSKRNGAFLKQLLVETNEPEPPGGQSPPSVSS